MSHVLPRLTIDLARGVRRESGTQTIVVPVAVDAEPAALALTPTEAELLHARLSYLLAGESVCVSAGITDL